MICESDTSKKQLFLMYTQHKTTTKKQEERIMDITITLSQELTDRLCLIREARGNRQTLEELSAELLEDAIWATGLQYTIPAKE